MIIRNETVSDIEAITGVTKAAFRTLAISNHTEQFIVAALLAAKALHEGVPEDVFFAMSFDGHIRQGIVVFHEGFLATC